MRVRESGWDLRILEKRVRVHVRVRVSDWEGVRFERLGVLKSVWESVCECVRMYENACEISLGECA
jgi:hypothetical protein